jgi:glycosyltransferase involved in cell wall biosynthesis
MKTLVILTPGFPKDEQDSTCLPAFQQFVLSIQKLYPKQSLIVVSFQYAFEKKDYLWFGNRVISIGGKNKPGVHRLQTWIKAWMVLNKLKTEIEITGILSLWLSECSLVAKYFCKFNGIKHYMWLIGQDAKKSNQYINRIKPKACEIIAMSDFLQEEYHRNFLIKPFMVAENGINTSSFPSLNISERKIDVLGVGSLIPLKNYSLFIEIIDELRLTFPNVNAVIAGAGFEEQILKEQVNRHGLQKNIRFTGMINHNQVMELMNNATIFLHTSDYEGNSTVLMEALYSGCHTISTQPLSNRQTKNLLVLSKKQEFINAIRNQLNQSKENAERVTFNTMDQSAKKIMELFIT